MIYPRRMALPLLLALLAGCGSGPPPATLTPAPETGVADSTGLIPDVATDSLAMAAMPESVAVDLIPAVTPLPPPADSTLVPAAEPWHLVGDRLTGTTDGLLEIDRPRIRHAGHWIKALHGVWRPEEERIDLWGSVEVRDSARVVTAARGNYYRTTEVLEMEQNVRGRGPEGNFSCQHLIYDPAQEVLRLSREVRLVEDGLELEAEWLNYVLPESVITAGGELRLFDVADSFEVRGDRLHSNRATGEMTVVADSSRRPQFVHQAWGGGALVVTADTLMLWSADRAGAAIGNVHFARGGITGTCQQAEFFMAEDRLMLLGSPRIDDAVGWVAGDSMAVAMRTRRADKLVVWGRAHSEYLPTGRPGEAHFTRGDSLSAIMADDVIESILVEGGAQALYLPSQRDAQEGIGVSWTRGRRLRLIMQASQVQQAQFEGDVVGSYVMPAPPDTARAVRMVWAETNGIDPRQLAVIRKLLPTESIQPADSLLREMSFDPGEKVEYAGDRIDFEVATDRITIDGNGSVKYGDMDLKSQNITFDARHDLVRAGGDPVLKDASSEVFGHEMTYRIDTKQGLVFQGRSEFESGFYRGERVKRVAEKTLYVAEGDFSTCDEDPPHFHFHSGRMKVISREKIFARPVVLYLGNIPLLAIPYAVFPSRGGRHSGILIPEVEFGFDSNRGRFLRNVGYYLAPNDYMDGLFWLDYYELNPRLTLNARTRYRVRYLLNGRFDASFTRQNASGGGRTDRWLLNVDHDQQLGERFSLKVSGRFQSDKDYGGDRDFSADVDERINRVLRSQMSLSKRWSGASFNLAADRTEYLDDSGGTTRINQSIPSINFGVSSFPLGIKADDRGRGGRLPALASMYVRGDMKLRNTHRETWDGAVTRNTAAGMNVSISDKRRVLGRVNLTPSARISTAWAHKDDSGRRDRTGVTWQTGFSANSTLYGTFLPGLGPWTGLRHVVELSALIQLSPRDRPRAGLPLGGRYQSQQPAREFGLAGADATLPSEDAGGRGGDQEG